MIKKWKAYVILFLYVIGEATLKCGSGNSLPIIMRFPYRETIKKLPS